MCRCAFDEGEETGGRGAGDKVEPDVGALVLGDIWLTAPFALSRICIPRIRVRVAVGLGLRIGLRLGLGLGVRIRVGLCLVFVFLGYELGLRLG